MDKTFDFLRKGPNANVFSGTDRITEVYAMLIGLALRNYYIGVEYERAKTNFDKETDNLVLNKVNERSTINELGPNWRRGIVNLATGSRILNLNLAPAKKEVTAASVMQTIEILTKFGEIEIAESELTKERKGRADEIKKRWYVPEELLKVTVNEVLDTFKINGVERKVNNNGRIEYDNYTKIGMEVLDAGNNLDVLTKMFHPAPIRKGKAIK